MRLVAVLVACVTSCVAPSPSTPPVLEQQHVCRARGPLPDRLCTPGAVETINLEVICHESTVERRNVTVAEKRTAFGAYGLDYPQERGAYEADHLIPLELGGSNEIANLWPESATPAPGFHEKDHVENALHNEVCMGHMSIVDAQRGIARDWTHYLPLQWSGALQGQGKLERETGEESK
jgi:hypothetical protein